MINKLNNNSKQTGDELSAQEWNQISGKVDELVEAYNTGGNTTVIDTSGILSTNDKGNVTLGNNSIKNINLEPGYPRTGTNKYGDIALKPGDDIQFASHHREPTKRDKVVLKILDGSDNPVKFEVHSGEISLSTKNKELTKKKDNTTGEDTANTLFKSGDEKTLDLKILTGVTLGSKANDDEREERGYLKVRAQAIDLRCEKHGGIALQPKGYDNEGNMNKIKFEHGGGDGLEFGTFNTEKTSLYTDEYRFKRDGIWKMATRQTTASGKTIYDDNTPNGKQSTGAYKYVKQTDDFYDIIDSEDETATTKSIIKTAHALNDGKNRHAKYEEKVTTKGELKKNLEIETVVTITYTPATGDNIYNTNFTLPDEINDPNKIYTISDFKDAIKTITINGVAQKYGTAGDDGITVSQGMLVNINGSIYAITENFSPSMDIISGAELSLKGKEKLSLGGNIVEFASDVVDLGEMEDGLYAQYKLTKKNNSKACDVLKVKVINNQTTPLSFDSDSVNFTVESFYPGSDIQHPEQVTIPGKVETPTTEQEANQHVQVVAQCKLIDVIKFVAWAKNNNFGPWSTNNG